MITFFTIPKPFEGRIGTIQRNAIESWLRVAPDVQVLLLGEGTDVAGVEHIPDIPRNEHGTPLVDGAFRAAAEHARHDVLCYVNTDILMPPSLVRAADSGVAAGRPFLAIGECWNVSVTERLDGDAWPAGGKKRGADAIDYFLFTRGLYDDVPPFAVGRMVWDNWLVWKARNDDAMVIDATWVVHPLHQDHTYAHMGSLQKLRVGPEANENRRLSGGGRERLYSRLDATHRLTPWGLVPNPLGVAHSGETVRRGIAKLGYSTGLRKA